MGEARALLGVDLDNTVISYDRALHRLARERGLIPPAVPATKRAVRDLVRATPDGELRWQELQAEIYGPRIADAEEMPGVRDAVAALTRGGVRLAVVSHKTRVAARGDGTDLRDVAVRWLECRGIFAAGLHPADVHFTDTREAKLARIGELGCRWFVDDMPEVLTAPLFPAGVERLLLAPERDGAPEWIRHVPTWEAVTRHVLRRDA